MYFQDMSKVMNNSPPLPSPSSPSPAPLLGRIRSCVLVRKDSQKEQVLSTLQWLTRSTVSFAEDFFSWSSSQGLWQCSLCSPKCDSHQQEGQEDRCTWYQARNKQMRRRHPSEVSALLPSCSIRQAVGMWANLRSCCSGQSQ